MADDLLESVRARAHANLFWRYLGIEVDAAGEGWIKLRVPIHDELRNGAGAPVHGGVLATLVDAAVGGALGTYGSAAAGGVDQATLDLNVTYIARGARRLDLRRGQDHPPRPLHRLRGDPRDRCQRHAGRARSRDLHDHPAAHVNGGGAGPLPDSLAPDAEHEQQQDQAER